MCPSLEGLADLVCVWLIELSFKMAIFSVRVVMAVSPSLSHFSQQKELKQEQIELHQKVSDECSSGVVRWCMRPRPLPGVCFLCAVYS